MINLVSISQALVVAEHRSFSRAAKVLRIQQSAVSRRIRALEDEIGVSLFERETGGVRLTEAGRAFLDRCRCALADIDFAVRNAANAGAGGEGSVRIGILSSLSAGFVRDLLVRFRVTHPAVVIEIAEGSTCDHIARLHDRVLDIAFVTGRPEAPRCDVALLWRARVFVVLPESHPLAGATEIAWDQIKGERFILSRQAPGPEIHDFVIQRLASLGFSPTVERYPVGRETLMHLVALGFGISVVSEAATGTRYPGVAVHPFSSAQDALPYSAVWLPGNDNPALRRLLSLARAMAPTRAQAARAAMSARRGATPRKRGRRP